MISNLFFDGVTVQTGNERNIGNILLVSVRLLAIRFSPEITLSDSKGSIMGRLHTKLGGISDGYI